MRREEFEHTIRAAGAVLDVSEVIVIDSQALHGSVSSDLPAEAVRSLEVDVAVPDDPDGTAADTIDGIIGEASMFHSTFGYYAQGVEKSTAVLPAGWRDRLVPFETSSTGGVTALCLEVHDLWIPKAIAGRPKDIEFCRALVKGGLVDPGVLRNRLHEVPELEPEIRDAVARRIAAAEGS